MRTTTISLLQALCLTPSARRTSAPRSWLCLRCPTEELRHGDNVSFVRFSPEGRHVLVLTEEGWAQVWDIAWSTATTGRDLVAQVCTAVLLGSARRLTLGDIAAATVLAGRIGEDVCTGGKPPHDRSR